MTRLSGRVVPSLLVRDLDRTLAFYGRLGFRQSGAWGEPEPVWAEVQRDDVAIQLYSEPPVDTPAEPVMSGTLYFHPDDVSALAAEWEGLVEFAWGPEVMEYGMREFAVRDPDGYLLAFTEPA